MLTNVQGWLKSITDFGVGLALMPLFNYINTSTGNDWTSHKKFHL